MRKLSFQENLRHRLRDLPHFRASRHEPRVSTEGLIYLSIGAVAGVAAGMALAQRFGGFGALTSRMRSRFSHDRFHADHRRDTHDGETYHGSEEEEDFYDEELSSMEALEERVLEAYHNDPILCERAIDIGAIDEGIIELTGWVYTADESKHAVTVARGTPGVDTVVNRIAIRPLEDEYDSRAQRYSSGEDDTLTERHWEGQQVGIGRTRQGMSGDPDRHSSPKVPLEEKWLNESEAYREAADQMGGIAERRSRGKQAQQGDRTGGAPIAPTGVPKADHVADPLNAPQSNGTGNTEAPRGD